MQNYEDAVYLILSSLACADGPRIDWHYGGGTMGKPSGIHKGEARQREEMSRDLVLSASTQALIHDKAAEMVDVRI